MKKGLLIALSLAGAAAIAAVALHKSKCHRSCREGECPCEDGCCYEIDNEVVPFLHPTDK